MGTWDRSSYQEIEDDFPASVGKFEILSPKVDNQNCIAFAIGDENRYWDPAMRRVRGYYWPPEAPADMKLESLVRVFEIHGYKKCRDATLETGFQKVAIYGDGVLWSHAAIQLPSGLWASKLGVGHDIHHSTLEALGGDFYGQPEIFMSRSISSARDLA